MPSPATASVRLKAAANRIEALRLREAGIHYREIATHLGVSLSTAFRYVSEELKLLRQRCGEAAEKVQAMELRRLDGMFNKLQRGIAAGDPKAVMAAIKIMERRAKLMGLDAPTKTETTTYAGMSDEQLRQEAERVGLDVSTIGPVS